MFPQLFNWRSSLALVAIAIVTGTIFYSNFLAKRIAADEKQKIEQWLQAVTDINDSNISSTNLASKILTENSQDIPMITVNEKDSILDHYNLDTFKIKSEPPFRYVLISNFFGLLNEFITPPPILVSYRVLNVKIPPDLDAFAKNP